MLNNQQMQKHSFFLHQNMYSVIQIIAQIFIDPSMLDFFIAKIKID